MALKQQVEACHETMELLELTWALADRVHPEKDYDYLLGHGSYQIMCELADAVRACQVEATTALRKYWERSPQAGSIHQLVPEGPTDLDTFKDWLNTHQDKPSSPTIREYAMRAAFAFVTGDDLDRKVALLVTKIDHLELFLKRRYDQLPNIATGFIEKTEVARYLKALLSLRDRSASVAAELSCLFEEAWRRQSLCSIVPRLKDREGHFLRFMDPGDLTVTFSIHPSNGSRSCQAEPIFSRLSQLSLPLTDMVAPSSVLSSLISHDARSESAPCKTIDL